MKIAFIGGVQFSHDLLAYILEKGWNVEIIFSYDDSRKKITSDYASFDDIAKKHQIQHVKVKKINDNDNLEVLQEIKPDLILVMGWSQLLSNDIIKIPKFGIVGSHPTELPKYRGRAPIPWSIIKNLTQSALTFFYIQEGVDIGDILDQRKFEINQDDDALSLYERITEIGKKMLDENLSLIEHGNAKRIKQDSSKFIENWPKRTLDDGMIDWSKSAKEIHTLIRASSHPYPGAFTFYKKSKLIIWKAKYSKTENGQAGKILQVSVDGIKIGCGDGIIITEKVCLINEKNPQKIFSKDDVGVLLG